MAGTKVHIRYRGEGQYLIGIPAKDFTEDEFAELEPFQQNEVLASDIYREVQHKDAKSSDEGDKSSSRTAESENN